MICMYEEEKLRVDLMHQGCLHQRLITGENNQRKHQISSLKQTYFKDILNRIF